MPEKLEIEIAWFPPVGWIACVSWGGVDLDELSLWDYIGEGCQCLSLDDLRQTMARSKDYGSAIENVQVWTQKWESYADRLLA